MGHANGIGLAREFTCDIELVQVAQRHVHRHGHERHAGLALGLHVLDDAVDHVHVEFLKQARFLQHGHKHVGRQLPVLGVDPARERLFPGYAARARTRDRLVVRPHPPFGNRLVDAVEHMDAQLLLAPHLVVEPHQVGQPHLPIEVARDLGAVEAHAHDVVFGVARIRACPHGQRPALFHLAEIGEEELHLLVEAPQRGEGVEVVLSEPRARLAPEVLAQQVGEDDQKIIALVPPILRVVGLHAHEVERHGNRNVPAAPHGGRAHFGELVETHHARQAREPVDGTALLGLGDEHVEHRAAVFELDETTEVLDGDELSRLRLYAVVDMVQVAVLLHLAPDAVLGRTEVLAVHEKSEAPVHELEEIIGRIALEQVDHVLVDVNDLLVAVSIVHNHATRGVVAIEEHVVLILRAVRTTHFFGTGYFLSQAFAFFSVSGRISSPEL